MKPFTAPAWNAHATFATSVLGILMDFGDPAAEKKVGPKTDSNWTEKKRCKKRDRSNIRKRKNN